MLRTSQIPPEEMSEVVRVASELYDREQAENRERQSTLDAAAEVGIPPEYMERAAAEVHARRVAQIQQKRQRRNGLLAALGAVAAIGAGWQLTRPAPTPRPAIYDNLLPTQWQLDKNRQSEATVTNDNGSATIRVGQFQKGTNDTYFVNLDTKAVPPTLVGYRTVSFHVRGNGLPNIRLYLENGNERWRSPSLPVSGEWQTHSLALKQFDYQKRRASGDSSSWRRAPYQGPETIERLSFKVGDFVNDVTARGEVSVDDLRFE